MSGKKCLFCKKDISSRNKYCSVECQHKQQKVETIENILNDKIFSRGSKALRKYLLETNSRCMNPDCGWDWNKEIKPILEIHHKDGNYLNNRLSNCILLCPNCHSVTDNFRNKGNRTSTRTYRKQYKNK